MSLPKLTQKAAVGQQLNKRQRDFNFNVAQIAKLKKKLAVNKEKLHKLNQIVASEFVPSERKIFDKDLELLYKWDEHYEQTFFRKKEKEKIADIISIKARELFRLNSDEAIKSLYNKYAGESSYDEEEELSNDFVKDFAKNIFGKDVNMENFDPNNNEKMQDFWKEFNTNQKTKPKTAKQLDQEAKAKQEEQNISKATRAIYMDLVKAFHPDREKDEQKKLEKTEVMKKITVAYEKDDLYNLLSLKLELLDNENDSFDLADNHLKYYLKLLRDQVKEFEMEIFAMERHCQTISPMVYNFFNLNEKQAEAQINTIKNKLKSGLKELSNHFNYIQDKQYVREYLKDYEIEEFDNDYDLFAHL